MKAARFSSVGWTYNGDNRYFYTVIDEKAYGITNIISDAYAVSSEQSVSTMEDYRIKGNASTHYVYVKDTRFSAVSDFQDATENYTMVYELTTPVIYTIPAPVIRSLLGSNNIWASTGNMIQLEYSPDLTMTIQSKVDLPDYERRMENIWTELDTKATKTDIVDTQAEICNDFRYEGETYTETLPAGMIVPYVPENAPIRLLRITTDIPAGSTIQQGTNAEVVNIAGLLAELIAAISSN